MGKVVFGGGVSAISGKVSGTVYARNKGGAYARNFAVPTNPNTQAQLDARDRLTQMSNEWRALAQAVQDAWAAWALTHPILDRLGAAIKLSAHGAFVKININRDLAGDATAHGTIPADPTFVAAIIDNSTALDADISDNVIEIALGAGALADQILAIFASPAVSAGVNNTLAAERLVEVHTLTAGEITAVKFDIRAAWAARFGGLAGLAGKKIIVNCYQYDEGQFASPTKVSGSIVA